MTNKHVTVSIPKGLIEQIDKIIKERKELGYRSRNEFCVSAIREKVTEIKRIEVLT